MQDAPIDLPAEVADYITAVPAPHRAVFDRLHALAVATIPNVRVILSYNMPAYVAASGRISLSSGPRGVSISTRVPEPVAAFHAKHPRFKAGKVSVLFPPDSDLPTDDIVELIAAAT